MSENSLRDEILQELLKGQKEVSQAIGRIEVRIDNIDKHIEILNHNSTSTDGRLSKIEKTVNQMIGAKKLALIIISSGAAIVTIAEFFLHFVF